MTVVPNKIKGTAQEFAEKWKVEKIKAYGLIQFLIAVGKARQIGSRKSEVGRGKPTLIYEIQSPLTLTME